MKLRIYQIEMSLDEHRIAFRSYTEMREKYPNGIPANLYRMAYEGEVPAKDFADVYFIFNIAHPEGYRARSLSVSDIIEVIEKRGSTFYYCDSLGFRKVQFDTSLVMK